MSFSLLNIEDNELDAERLKRLLRQVDDTAEYHWVPDLKSLNNLNPDDYDIVLLDLCLPGHSGSDTFNNYKTYNFNIPLIVLSGIDNVYVAKKMVTMGAQDYLNKKNITEDTLGKSIEYAIERFKYTETLREQQIELEKQKERLELSILAGKQLVWDFDIVKNKLWVNQYYKDFIKAISMDYFHWDTLRIHREDR